MKNIKNIEVESVVERLYLAVRHLAIEKGNVRDRLIVVAFDLLPLLETDFPADLRDDFNWIWSQMTKYKSEFPQFSGDVEVTMRRIRNSTGQKIAERIFDLYSDVQELRGHALL